ncbi:MAG: diguanylate cyclase [Dermatophilaceae bacterium]
MQREGRAAALIVGVIGALVLVGWYSGVTVFTTVLPGYVSMKPNAALGLIAIAAALMSTPGRWTVPLGALSALVGGATLLEYLLGRSLGVDQLLPGIDLRGSSPRMAPATAVALLLLGSAVMARRYAQTTLVRGLAIGAFGLGQIAILGYAYRVSSLYTVGGYTSMAIHTALSVGLLALSVLLLDPSGGLAGLFRDQGSAGRLVRPMVPFLVLGPSVLGWLALWAQDQGWIDSRFGVSVLVMSMTILGGGITWWATLSMRDLEKQRFAAAKSLAQTNEMLEATVIERTQELAQRQSFVDALLETVGVGIVSCDAQGNSLTRNRAEREMSDPGHALQGSMPDGAAPKFDLLELDGRPLTAEHYPLARALRGEDAAGELLLGPPGGPYREVVVRGDQIIGPAAEVLGAVVSVTDVTKERTVTRALALEHSNLEEAQRLGQLGSFEHDFATGTWTYSDQLCALWGVGPGSLDPLVIENLVHEEDRGHARQSWASASDLGGSHVWQYRIHRAGDSAGRLIRSSVEVELDAGGEPLHARGTHMDITDLTEAQHRAQEANDFLEAVLAATPDYTFVTELATGRVLYGSPGKKILGITAEELQELGPDITKLVHPEDRQRLEGANVSAADLVAGQVLQLLYRARSVAGEWRWLSRRVTPFRRDASGKVVEVLGVTRDVTDVVAAEDKLRHVGLHDSLTGLPNRALLVERLDKAIARSGLDGREVAVLYCDLDGFKRVNDTAGHAAGDEVLVETARRLQALMRPDDTVARVGGDEFVVVLEPWKRTSPSGQPEDDIPGGEGIREQAQRVAERVLGALSQPIEVKGVEHLVTASIGIAYAKASPAARAETAASDEVLHDADAAMYLAKNRGKGRFEVFERGLPTEDGEPGRVDHVLR